MNRPVTYGAYTCENLNSDLLFVGEPLPEMQAEVERGRAFAEKARFGLVINFIAMQLALIRMLRGLTLTMAHWPKLGAHPKNRLRVAAVEPDMRFLRLAQILGIRAVVCDRPMIVSPGRVGAGPSDDGEVVVGNFEPWAL
jgi:hypothetical protein